MRYILIVDDDPCFLNLVKNLLMQNGMSVQCAANGQEALSELKANAFDLMITDYDMPGLDGICLTRHSVAIAPDMPVILMTGNISSDIPNMAKQAGVSKVLPKPFNSENLLEAVRIVTGCNIES